jgi:hypothetical protein
MQEPDQLVYTTDVQDIDLWDALARQALIQLLASKLAEPISGRLNAYAKHQQAYDRTVAEAKLASARESHKHYGSRKNGSPEYPAAMSSRFGITEPTQATLFREIPT